MVRGPESGPVLLHVAQLVVTPGSSTNIIKAKLTQPPLLFLLVEKPLPVSGKDAGFQSLPEGTDEADHAPSERHLWAGPSAAGDHVRHQHSRAKSIQACCRKLAD